MHDYTKKLVHNCMVIEDIFEKASTSVSSMFGKTEDTG